MKVLYLAHTCPYPPNKGERIRSFHVLRALSGRYETRLIYPSFSTQDVDQAETLRAYCHDVSTVRLSARLASIRAMGAPWQGRPCTLSYFYSRRLQRLVDRDPSEVVLVDCTAMAPYVEQGSKPCLLDFVDVDSDKWRLYAEHSSPPFSWLYRYEARSLRRYEEACVSRFAASVVVSDHERACLPHPDRVSVIPNGVDLTYFHPPSRPPSPGLVFCGAMNYLPNIDAVLYFRQRVLPLVHRQQPRVPFHIAGHRPVPAVRRLAGEHVSVEGDVSDIRRSYAKGMVCVVPLRIAKGVQNKVLEAMAMGIPVVATSVANNGIRAIHGKEILIADTPEDFAQAVVTLLNDRALREALASAARRFVEREFSWKAQYDKWQGLLARVPVDGAGVAVT